MKVRDAIRALPAPVAQETKDAALTWIEMLDKAGGFSDKMTASADGDAIRMDVQGDRFNVFLHLAPRLAAGAVGAAGAAGVKVRSDGAAALRQSVSSGHMRFNVFLHLAPRLAAGAAGAAG